MSETTASSAHVTPEKGPDPQTLRLAVDRELLKGAGREFPSPLEAEGSPLPEALFALPAVASVFVGPNYVTVRLHLGAKPDDWQPLVVELLESHLASGAPAVRDEAAPAGPPRPDAEVEAGIQRVLDEEIRPALAMDGGDAVFVGMKDGIVRMQLRGACHGCPGAAMTLKFVVERRLRREFPEIKAVEAV